jgi:hypothetical protein
MNNNVDGKDASLDLRLLAKLLINDKHSFKNLNKLIIYQMGGMRTKPDAKKTTVSR